MVQFLAFLSTPLGQAMLTVAGYLIAKRFPLAQRLIWAVLDLFKVPHPDRPQPAPGPGPQPQPVPVVDPDADDVRPVRDLLRELLGTLASRGQFAAAAKLLTVAPELDADGDGIPDRLERGTR